MKLLVIIARGVRAGALGPYGNPWLETPCLDALAHEAIVFDWHCADRADTHGAHRAWRSGRYDLPHPPHVSQEDSTQPLAPGPDLLALLRERGVFTCLVVDNSNPVPPQFEEGWDHVEKENNLEATLEVARSALDDLADRDDWLLWVELATALPPWEVPDEFREPYFNLDSPAEDVEEDGEDGDEEPAEDSEEEESESEDTEFQPEPLSDIPVGPLDPEDDQLFLSLHASYGSAVSYLDAGVGALLEALAEAQEDVAVLFTSDHGLPLNEHGVAGLEGSLPHNELIHLPLILCLPRSEGAGRRVDALTQSVDLAPTLASWFGVTFQGVHGHDLLPLARRETASVRPCTCSGVGEGETASWALRTPEWSLVVARSLEEGSTHNARLYVKPDDPWEVNDVAQQHHELVEHLEKVLFALIAATRQPGPLEVPPLEPPATPGGTSSDESAR